MWGRYCPMIQAECRDGKTDRSEPQCANWNSIDEECSLCTGVRLGCEFYRKTINTPSFESMFSQMLEQQRINTRNGKISGEQ